MDLDELLESLHSLNDTEVHCAVMDGPILFFPTLSEEEQVLVSICLYDLVPLGSYGIDSYFDLRKIYASRLCCMLWEDKWIGKRNKMLFCFE